MPLTATFDPALTVTIKKGTLSADTTIKNVEIIRMIDSPEQRSIHAELSILPGHLFLLWGPDEYDKAGQWTDDDAQSRISSSPIQARIQSVLTAT